jgi:FAD/FMN-containing dehydrogenase
VVTAAGERVICSADREPDVFFSVLGSEGAGGIITRARLPLVPAPRRIRACRVPCPDAGALMAAQLALVREGRFGYVEGQITLAVGGGWDFAAEIAAYADEVTLPPGAVDVEEVSYRDFCHRMVPGVRLLAATGDWYRPHPWFSAFLPAATAEGFVNAALAGLRAATVGPLPMLLYPMRRGRAPAPGLVTPGDEPFFAFTILRTTEGGDALAEALAGNGRLAAAAAAAGGAVYPISALP